VFSDLNIKYVTRETNFRGYSQNYHGGYKHKSSSVSYDKLLYGIYKIKHLSRFGEENTVRQLYIKIPERIFS